MLSLDNKEFVDISSRSSGANAKKNSANKKALRRNIAIRITSGVFALLFAFAGFVCFWVYTDIIGSSQYKSAELNKNNKDKVSVTLPEGQEYTGPVEENVYNEQDLLSTDDVLNIMLFGADRYGDQGLSDTMILLSLDNRNKKIKMTSFLRDTYVSIPDYYPHKLNLAYSLGGLYEGNAAGLSIKTIEANYGIRIDRYATVNFSTFMDIVDILGGVELYVTENEIGYINAQIAYNGQSEYLYASEGMVTLNGQQALWYARNRGGFGYGGDDWDRTDRQRKFLEAVINDVKDASLSELIQIVNSVGPNITTNLKKTEIQALLTRALTYLNYDIEQCHMPPDGMWSYGWDDYAGSIIVVDDWDGARRTLAEFIYEDKVQENQ